MRSMVPKLLLVAIALLIVEAKAARADEAPARALSGGNWWLKGAR